MQTEKKTQSCSNSEFQSWPICMGRFFYKEHWLTKVLHSSASKQTKSKGKEWLESCNEVDSDGPNPIVHPNVQRIKERFHCSGSESRLYLLSFSWTLIKRSSSYLDEHFYASFMLLFSLGGTFFHILQELFFARLIGDRGHHTCNSWALTGETQCYTGSSAAGPCTYTLRYKH